MDDDELLDLVNIRDEVIGTLRRSEYDVVVVKEGCGYVRACEMLIQNDEGKFWIPTRTNHKRIAPGGLDYSMGGHVSAGETYLQSALREIREELNLELTAEDLIEVHKFPPDNLPFFRTLYVYHSNQTPDFNADDFTHAEWLSADEVLRRLDDGVKAKKSLRQAIEYM